MMYITWFTSSWIWLYLTVANALPTTSRRTNDISTDFNKLRPAAGNVDSVLKSFRELVHDSQNCKSKEVPKLKKHLLLNSSATCNDGSPSGYYLHKSYGSSKWIIYLEGGWFCFDNFSCNSRWVNHNMQQYMSSKLWPEVKRGTGILSWHPDDNPYYFHSNMVYIPYCSSDSWSGTNKNPDGIFSFMGSLIIDDVIEDLLTKGLGDAQKVIMTGSSAGGIGVLLNIDRVADMIHKRSPKVEVRGIADSGWFLDNEQFRSSPCYEVYSCGPTDVTKKGIQMWKGRVPKECAAMYPENEMWRCYFGYRLYPSIKTPVYIIQYLFDEAQIAVDNVFDDMMIHSRDAGPIMSKDQWEYLQKLAQEMKHSLKNVSAVFAPACLSHEILTKSDWHKVSINGISLGQSIYCWESSHEVLNSFTKSYSIFQSNHKPLGDEPTKSKSKSKKGKKKKKKNKKRNKNRRKNRKRHRNRHKKGKKGRRGKRSKPLYTTAKSCHHRLIDRCPWPQCNCSCPKYRTRFTDQEINFIGLFLQYGVNLKIMSEALDVDMKVLQSITYDTLMSLIKNEA